MQRRSFLITTGATALLPAHGWAAAAVGQPAPAFALSDTAGKPVRLADFKGKPVVLEWNNPGCPFVRKHYQGNMQALQKEATAQGVVWLAINSTESASGDYLDPALAWTGVKDTGRGCSLSVLGFDALTRPKSYHLRAV